ncbi:MAG: ATP-dependent sacrificial sulfur transferase LarE [Candidatus Magnetoovum sp. WYHC-5]|nr:ATP-dependent sacrificial sulfur transferase LarE [Candidatus Magnetoovum sp. WYHC-5]
MNGYQDLLDSKYEKLLKRLRTLGKTVLAYSGGVDSTFLLYALKAAGVEFLVITAYSPSMPVEELNRAKEQIAQLYIAHRIIQSTEFEDEDYLANTIERCFYCKRKRWQMLSAIAKNEGYAHIVDGTNESDKQDYRPGIKANKIYNVISPLEELHINKDEIRLLSKLKGLSTWNRPSFSCLSTRIPYGERITVGDLKMIESAERLLRELGFNQLRVRKYATTAKIEVELTEISKVIEPNTRQRIVDGLKDVGFLYITLDIEGFQSGKLNRGLSVY